MPVSANAMSTVIGHKVVFLTVGNYRVALSAVKPEAVFA